MEIINSEKKIPAPLWYIHPLAIPAYHLGGWSLPQLEMGDVMVHDSMSCVVSYVVSYVLIFCPLFVSRQCSPLCSILFVFPFVFSPSALHVCLSLSVSIVSFMLSPLCLSLIFSPVLLPPLFPPIPCSIISVSMYLSLGFPMYSLSVCCWCCVWCFPWSSCFSSCVPCSSAVCFWILISGFSMFDLNVAFLFARCLTVLFAALFFGPRIQFRLSPRFVAFSFR